MSYEAWGDGDDGDDWHERAAEHGWYSPDDLSQAEKDVIRERARQVDLEGFTLADDDAGPQGRLASMAGSYLWAVYMRSFPDAVSEDDISRETLKVWPGDKVMCKPKSDRADLVRATALLIAEIERLDRVSAATKGD